MTDFQINGVKKGLLSAIPLGGDNYKVEELSARLYGGLPPKKALGKLTKLLELFDRDKDGNLNTDEQIDLAVEMAKNSSYLLTKLIKNKDNEVKIALLRNVGEKFSPEILKELSMINNEKIKEEVAQLTKQPDVLSELAKEGSIKVKLAVAGSHYASPETLDELAGLSNREIKLAVAKNPNAMAKTLDKLSKAEDEEIKLAVSRHHNTSLDTSRELYPFVFSKYIGKAGESSARTPEITKEALEDAREKHKEAERMPEKVEETYTYTETEWGFHNEYDWDTGEYESKYGPKTVEKTGRREVKNHERDRKIAEALTAIDKLRDVQELIPELESLIGEINQKNFYAINKELKKLLAKMEEKTSYGTRLNLNINEIINSLKSVEELYKRIHLEEE